ncbi:MAG TPA: TonB-dependent receptor [Opitutus sp.]|nr:TonB-dependent receptor [Opitutus sp.]
MAAGLFLPAAIEAASVSGTVRNQRTGAYLEGAEITVDGKPTVFRTDRTGRFTIEQLEPGARQLRVEYPGLEPEALMVEATDTAPRAVDVGLRESSDEAEALLLEKFVVTTEKEGYAASVARQKAANNIENVLSMDTYGTVADGNIGNFLQRVAGIAVNKDAGDAVGVIVRGAPPELNSVTMDGVRLASADSGINQGDRSVRIDHLPSEFIKEIEVVKANTADQWSDSIGGTVNLVTKSAFDYRNPVLTYSAGYSVNTYRDDLWDWRPQASISYLTTLGQARNVGVALSASHNESTHPRDWVQVQRLENDGRVTQARRLDDIVYRIRRGLSSKFEFRLANDLEVRFDAAVNQYKQSSDRNNLNISDSGGRRVADYSRVSRAAIENGTQPRTATNQTASVAPGYTDTYTEMLHATFVNQRARGDGETETYKVGTSVKKTFDSGLVVTAGGTFSRSVADSSFNAFAATTRGIGLGIDSTNPERPVFTQTYGRSIGADTDMRYYTGVLNLSFSHVKDEIGTAYVDASQSFHGKVPMNVKAGAAFREQYRYSRNWAPRWNYVGPNGVQGPANLNSDDNLARFLNPNPTYGLFNGYYDSTAEFNFQSIYQDFLTTPSNFAAQPNFSNVPAPASEVDEQVFAAYAMSDFSFGKLIATAGVRYEGTRIDAIGSYSDPQLPDKKSISKEGSYDNFFPGLHLKYSATKQLIFRGSVTTSFARPSLANVAPSTTVSYSSAIGAEGTLTQNNPNLKPQYSENFDLMAEYYFRPSGVISVGVFRKDIDDFISSDNYIIGAGPDNGFGGQFEGFEYRTKRNLGSAKIQGIEFDYNQKLPWLPSRFGALTVFGNATFLETEGNYGDGVNDLVNFVPRTYNAGLAHSWRNLTLRAAFTYKSDYLVNYNGDPLQAYRNSADRSLDLNVRYRFSNAIAVYVDMVNVLNEGSFWYNLDNKNRVLKSEITGMRLTLGVTGRF